MHFMLRIVTIFHICCFKPQTQGTRIFSNVKILIMTFEKIQELQKLLLNSAAKPVCKHKEKANHWGPIINRSNSFCTE